MKKIKPCCLCGSETIKLWRAVVGGGKKHVECEICHNCGPHKRTVRGAVRAWRLIWARRCTGIRREISVVSSVFCMGPKMAR